MPKDTPEKTREEDLKNVKSADSEAGKVNEVKPLADAKQSTVTRAEMTPSASQQQEHKENVQNVGGGIPGFGSSPTASGTGEAGIGPGSRTNTSSGAMTVSSASEYGSNPASSGEGTQYLNVTNKGPSTITTDDSLSTLSFQPDSGAVKQQQNAENKVLAQATKLTPKNIRTNVGTQATGGNVTVTGQPPAGPNGQNYTVNNNVLSGQMGIYDNKDPMQLQTTNGVYDQTRMNAEAQKAGGDPVDALQQVPQDIEKEGDDLDNEIGSQDAVRTMERDGAALASYLDNQAKGSAYEHEPPKSTWGQVKEFGRRNAGALAVDAVTGVASLGDAVNRGLDVFDKVMSMTFQGGLHPGMIGHTIGMSYDAAGKIFDDAVKNVGAARGVDLDKLKQDKNAIGTIKGMQAIQEETELKNAGLDAQKVAGQAMAEAIGWSGGEMRPEHMEQALRNMTPEQLQAYGTRLQDTIEQDPSYIKIMDDFNKWQLENPGVPASKYNAYAREGITHTDVAKFNAYQQMLSPIKQANKESDMRMKGRAREYKTLNRDVRQALRDLNDAKRQGKAAYEAKLQEFNQMYYDSVSDRDRRILDILGGPHGKFTVDAYGNIGSNSLQLVRRELEARGATELRKKDPSQLTPQEKQTVEDWEYVNKMLEDSIQGRKEAKQERRAEEIRQYNATHSPVDQVYFSVGLTDANKRSSTAIDPDTHIPRDRGVRAKVRSACNSIIENYEDMVGRNLPTTPEQDAMYNSAMNTRDMMGIYDKFSWARIRLGNIASNPSDPVRAKKAEDALKDLTKKVNELAKQKPVDTDAGALTTSYVALDPTADDSFENMLATTLNDFGLTEEAKEEARRVQRENREADRLAREEERKRKEEEARAQAKQEWLDRYDSGSFMDRHKMLEYENKVTGQFNDKAMLRDLDPVYGVPKGNVRASLIDQSRDSMKRLKKAKEDGTVTPQIRKEVNMALRTGRVMISYDRMRAVEKKLEEARKKGALSGTDYFDYMQKLDEIRDGFKAFKAKTPLEGNASFQKLTDEERKMYHELTDNCRDLNNTLNGALGKRKNVFDEDFKIFGKSAIAKGKLGEGRTMADKVSSKDIRNDSIRHMSEMISKISDPVKQDKAQKAFERVLKLESEAKEGNRIGDVHRRDLDLIRRYVDRGKYMDVQEKKNALRMLGRKEYADYFNDLKALQMHTGAIHEMPITLKDRVEGEPKSWRGKESIPRNMEGYGFGDKMSDPAYRRAAAYLAKKYKIKGPLAEGLGPDGIRKYIGRLDEAIDQTYDGRMKDALKQFRNREVETYVRNAVSSRTDLSDEQKQEVMGILDERIKNDPNARLEVDMHQRIVDGYKNELKEKERAKKDKVSTKNLEVDDSLSGLTPKQKKIHARYFKKYPESAYAYPSSDFRENIHRMIREGAKFEELPIPEKKSKPKSKANKTGNVASKPTPAPKSKIEAEVNADPNLTQGYHRDKDRVAEMKEKKKKKKDEQPPTIQDVEKPVAETPVAEEPAPVAKPTPAVQEDDSEFGTYDPDAEDS